MFGRVDEARFIGGEHEVLRWWDRQGIFLKLLAKNAGGPKWSFLDGPITANNPMGVHHAWGRTYKDAYQRYRAMTGHELRYQNGFDCQGLWVEVEVEKEMGLGTKSAIAEHGIDRFVRACKQRVLTFAARQTEQSVRLGYWMEWDDPDELRKLAAHIEDDSTVKLKTPKGVIASGTAEELTARLGNPEWGGSYFTFSTENNETIWTFLKKCFERGKIYLGHDVMPWGGLSGSAYSQMEVADGRKLTTHRSCFVRFPIIDKPASGGRRSPDGSESVEELNSSERSTDRWVNTPRSPEHPETNVSGSPKEYLLVWTTTPWTLTSNVAAAVNPDLEYVRVKAQIRGDEEPAYYYFAKENLDSKRLEREYKEGFGRPEWQWPDGLGKLKTIAQIFKEQGGFEEEGTIKGEELIGWRYAGPFDDLNSQQTPGGYPSLTSGEQQSPDVSEPPETLNTGERSTHPETYVSGSPTGVDCHRVIDGGRDFKGNPHVIAGEGTGIVHIAPGCGDVDHQIGAELGLVSIAPLQEDGSFGDGFGPFTGRKAIDPETANLVFEELKRKGYLVYVEEYPHIYPHCWRTGEELVFRLVDEWFINMDWREEIKEVTKAITWLPESIQGQEREIEWLTTMRDWMISKKRFWGLALPIWVNPHDASDFKVVGSLAELKELATSGGEGWDEFEGHTPHRPWIDAVMISSDKHPGQLLQRVEDVGNPWLDAGITPFSTMNYSAWTAEGGRRKEEWTSTINHQPSTINWPDWYPADFVTECFPGQFRNWFYSLLALSTMMRYDETDKPDQKRPFKCLLGHRLVMDEHGQPMHKSDGTAIWFEEAAEQLGVDTLRWLYLAQNPAADLRFGTRHPDEPVTLNTPEGPITETKEGLPTCKVTSKPADEIRRQVLIPLWNSYAFFVNYAVADEFDPTLAQVPLGERLQIDRWILSRLQELIEVAHDSFQTYDVARFMEAAATYIDDLSNWYIRRNRRRFWRSRAESTPAAQSSRGAGWDADKLAAYQTMHEVLLTLTKLLAPCIPFMTERMYQNLTGSTPASGGRQSPDGGGSGSAGNTRSTHPETDVSGSPESVHLCDYPAVDEAKLDRKLNHDAGLVQTLVRLGHRLRESAELRVRQPLAELRFATADDETAAVLEEYSELIQDELNVKTVTRADNLDELVSYTYKPNLKTLGPKHGKLLGAIRKELPEVGGAILAPLRNDESVTLTLGGADVTLEPDDVLVSTEQASDWASGDGGGIQVALSTALTAELIREGMARDFVRHIQQARKDAGLEITDRIHVFYFTEDEEAAAAIEEWAEYIMAETLADAITRADAANADAKKVVIGESQVSVWIERV